MCNFRLFLAIFTLIGLFAGCSTDSGPPPPLEDGTFAKSGLENTPIHTFYLRNNTLFSGTANGIFKYDIANNTTEWSYIGLGSDSTEVIDIIAWDKQEIMVAINYHEYHPNNQVILKTKNGGGQWVSLTEQFTNENISNFLRRLALDISSPDEIFALGGLPIARTTDRGQSWETVFETWQLTGFGRFITINSQNTENIYSGGATNVFSPSLIKSVNGGNTWQRLEVIKNVETTVHDLIINPQNSDDILAGLSGVVPSANLVRKSTDGGQSWQTVLEGYNIRTLAHSARGQGRVYASGINEARRPFFAASTNFGDDWEIVEMEGATEALFINDMISVMEGATEVLYFGTTKGMYKYMFEE